MPRGAAAVVVLSSLCATSACAAKHSAPNAGQNTTQAASSGSETSADARKSDGKREMTWDEYYVDVEQRTRHAGGFVMWFNPPRLARRSRASNEPMPNTPPPGNALDPAH